MKQISRSVMTVVVIFGAAFVLAAVGCAKSNSSNSAAPTESQNGNNELNQSDSSRPDSGSAQLQPTKPDQVRECTQAEFSQLVSWKNTLDQADLLIEKMGKSSAGWKQSPQVVNAAVAAIKMCDSRFAYHSSEPCKKTTQLVVDPDHPKVVVYDAYRIQHACSEADAYLKKFNLRPDSSVVTPVPVSPVQVQPLDPGPIAAAPVNSGSISDAESCSADEFSRLSQWSAQLDSANKNIAKLGALSDWKYDSAAISSAIDATKSCETLMQYHALKPCQKSVISNGVSSVKQYTHDSIGQRCETARKYFYEFVQRTTTLNSPNVDLVLDMSNFGQSSFTPKSQNQLQNCVVENPTDNLIQLSSSQTLITASHVYIDQYKMMVLNTQEGLKISCYGLDFDGPFSKNQLTKLLKSNSSDIRLSYILK